MNSSLCKRACRLWSDAFDGGAPVPPAIAKHLADCPACREFQTQSEHLREELAATPLPASSPVRDQEFLTLLRPPVVAEPRFWVRVWQSLRSPAVPVLGALGFAAFAVTLVTAHLLTVLPTEPGGRTAPGAASARTVDQTPRADPIERWLASPQPRLIPLRPSAREPFAPGFEIQLRLANPAAPGRRGNAAPNDHGKLSRVSTPTARSYDVPNPCSYPAVFHRG